ncbi:Palmitoyltransferase [Fasciola gigantica]|uniref:Palmitoyltransferase n=1 Tax=Fasciola gigantica TaxID=46835 RepID=A0A504YCB8_FASGI|nr:Palmitoyltransferase [Fasciola gigantica]
MQSLMSNGNAHSRYSWTFPKFLSLSTLRAEQSVQFLFRSLLSVYVCILVLLDVFYIMPVLFSGYRVTFIVYFSIGLYLLVGFVYNAIQVVRKDPSIRGMLLSNKVTRHWTYCVSCQSPRPPRTHHCHVCNICVLRRDHHCVFLAQCIGLANWHHFFSLLVFGAFGAALASRFNLTYVFHKHFLPDDWSVGFRVLCMIAPPGAFWILRQITLWQTLVFAMTTTCLLFCCFMFSFGFYYISLISCNETLSDRTARNKALAVDPSSRTMETEAILANATAHIYDVGWKANISQFLGHHWFLTVLVPFTPCTLTTDGLSFPRSDDVKCR